MNPEQITVEDEYIREEAGYYPFKVTLTANQNLPDQSVTIDGDSDFLITGICGTQSGIYRLNFKSNNGRYIAQSGLLNANLVGTGQFPVPLPKPLFVPARGRIGVDIQDISGSTNPVELVFIGLRLFAK